MKRYLCVIGNFYAPCSSSSFIDYVDIIYKNGDIIDVYIDTTVIRQPSLSEKKTLSRIFYNSNIKYLQYTSFITIFKFFLKEKFNAKRKYSDFLVDGSYSAYQKALLSIYVANNKNLCTFCCTTPYILYEIK
jgi:hypothetical protein